MFLDEMSAPRCNVAYCLCSLVDSNFTLLAGCLATVQLVVVVLTEGLFFR